MPLPPIGAEVPQELPPIGGEVVYAVPAAAPAPTTASVMVNGQPMSIEDYNASQQAPVASPQSPPGRDAFLKGALFGVPPEVAIGVAKGLGRSVLAAGSAIRRPQNPLSDEPPMVSDAALQQMREGLEYRNPQQRIGGAIETAAELAVPLGKVAEAVPSTVKAGAKFQEVMGAARTIPVDTNVPGQVALRINELAERGGSMPMAVRKFLNRITDPQKPGLVYEEARDFASNISRLSANEFQRLTPVVAKEVAALRVSLNRAIADAAGKAGKGKEYAEAMNEYARAMKLKKAIDTAVEGAKRGVPMATAAGVGYWLTQKVRQALGE